MAGAESEQSLKDLKAELEAARDMLNLPDGAKSPSAQQWLERLAALPQLRKQLDREPQAAKGWDSRSCNRCSTDSINR